MFSTSRSAGIRNCAAPQTEVRRGSTYLQTVTKQLTCYTECRVSGAVAGRSILRSDHFTPPSSFLNFARLRYADNGVCDTPQLKRILEGRQA